MPSLKSHPDINTIDSAYLDKAIVYLESGEDIQIIKERWFFDEGRYVEFKSADDGEGGGCATVIERVNFERAKGIKTFGIVDRDALLRCHEWDTWWEADDLVFDKKQPFGEHIKVLKRWEIENYLLNPHELEIVLADMGLRSMRTDQAVIESLLAEAEKVKLLSAAEIYCHKNGLRFPRGFGEHETIDTLNDTIDKYLKKFENYEPGHLNEYVKNIESFAEGITTISYERWERINRLLDGKRMLRCFGLIGHPPSDRRGDIARHIRLNGTIDPEILSYMEIFKEAGRS